MGSAASPYLSPLQIATELTSPTQRWYLSLFGDSRTAFKQNLFIENAPEVAWVGAMYFTNTLSPAHATVEIIAQAGNTPQSSSYADPVDWTWGGVVAEYTGVSVTSVNYLGRRMTAPNASLTFSSALCPTLWTALLGTETHLRGWVYGVAGHADVSPDVRLWARTDGTAYNAANPVSDPLDIETLADGEYAELTATLPDGWAAASGTIYHHYMGDPAGGATTLGELVALSPIVIELASGNGVVLLDYSIGGEKLFEHYLDPSVFPPQALSGWIARVGEKHVAWIAIGTNGGDADPEFVAHMKSWISTIRSALGSDTPIVITTEYDASADAGEKQYVAGLYQVERDVGGVLLLDTRAALPAYAEGVALGYYGDITHYNVATGVPVFGATIGDLIAEVVANGANHQGYLGTDLTTDPLQVGVEFELSGVGTVGSAVVVTVNGEAWGSTTCGSDGSWSITNTPTVAMRGAGTDIDVVVTFGPTRMTTRPTTIAAAA